MRRIVKVMLPATTQAKPDKTAAPDLAKWISAWTVGDNQATKLVSLFKQN